MLGDNCPECDAIRMILSALATGVKASDSLSTYSDT